MSIVPMKRHCDICKSEVPFSRKPISVPIKTRCNWTDGYPEPEHIEWENIDICGDCLLKATNIVADYRRTNLRIERGSDT